jgi:hypothetical protein
MSASTATVAVAVTGIRPTVATDIQGVPRLMRDAISVTISNFARRGWVITGSRHRRSIVRVHIRNAGAAHDFSSDTEFSTFGRCERWRFPDRASDRPERRGGAVRNAAEVNRRGQSGQSLGHVQRGRHALPNFRRYFRRQIATHPRD